MIREFKYLASTISNIEEVQIMENDRTTTTVEVADKSGHSTLQLTKEETLERVSDSPGAWVFANNQMVQPGQLFRGSCLHLSDPDTLDVLLRRMY